MMSIEELARITPVRPPTVNRNTNPNAHNIGVSYDKWAPNRVAIHLKIFTPVGMAMIMVAAVK